MDDEQMRSFFDKINAAVGSAKKRMAEKKFKASLMTSTNSTLDPYHKVPEERLEELLDASLFDSKIEDRDILDDIFDALIELKYHREKSTNPSKENG